MREIDYFDDGLENDWDHMCHLARLESKQEATIIEGKNYKKLVSHIKKWRGQEVASGVDRGNRQWVHEVYPSDFTDDDCMQLACFRLASMIESRAKCLRKVANMYRKNSLEDLSDTERLSLIRKKLGYSWHGFSGGKWYPIDYPMSKLNIRRLKHL